MSIQRLKVGPRMSQATIHGDTVYLAGQVADDTDADVAGQTRQILAKIDALLAEAGSSKDRLLQATVWLADVGDYDAINQVWDAWVQPGAPPARACVGAPLAGPEYRIEIGAIAAR
jgi:enamine deaminase RidA (YjgF/YER057c/UK114 family)